MILRDGFAPGTCTEVTAGEMKPIDLAGAAKITGLKFQPWETRVILTPHQEIAAAPVEWLNLQRDWWRGSADRPGRDGES